MEGISAINVQPRPVKRGKITKAQDVLEARRVGNVAGLVFQYNLIVIPTKTNST